MIVTTLHVAPAAPALVPQPAALPRRPSLLASAALAASLAALVIAAVAFFEPGPAQVAAAPAISAPRQAQELIAEARARLSGPGAHEARISAAMPLFEQALALDPRSAEAASELAFGHANRVASRLSTDPAADLAMAVRFAERAMQLAPEASIAQHAQAVVLRHQGRFAEALPLFESAGRDPERITARAGVGLMHLLLGAPERAVPPLETLRLEAPEHPFFGTWRVYLGLARLMGGIGDHGAADFAAAAPRGTILSRPERLAPQLAALSLNGEAQAAARLRALLERLALDMLAEPPSRFAMSNEPAYLARFEERIATPLRQWGWAGR
jgi:tetratricopeptide (TPR) repeat protein